MNKLKVLRRKVEPTQIEETPTPTQVVQAVRAVSASHMRNAELWRELERVLTEWKPVYGRWEKDVPTMRETVPARAYVRSVRGERDTIVECVFSINNGTIDTVWHTTHCRYRSEAHSFSEVAESKITALRDALEITERVQSIAGGIK
jgi:hypothetical protein